MLNLPLFSLAFKIKILFMRGRTKQQNNSKKPVKKMSDQMFLQRDFLLLLP